MTRIKMGNIVDISMGYVNGKDLNKHSTGNYVFMRSAAVSNNILFLNSVMMKLIFLLWKMKQLLETNFYSKQH